MHRLRWPKRVGAAGALLSLGLTLVGCGAGGANTPASTSSTAPAQSTPATTTTTPKSSSSSSSTTLLQKVESTKTLTVALAPFAPLEFQGTTSKKWQGFDIDMLSAFASTLGAKLTVQDMPFAATIEAVSKGRADVTANIFKTSKRAQQVSFSNPVLTYVDGVIVNSTKPGITQDTVAALTGKTIATCRGCAEENFVPKIPKATDKSYGTAEDTFLAVSQGRVPAAFQPVMYAQYDIHKDPSLKIKVLGPIPAAVAGAAQKPQGFYTVEKGAISQTFLAKLNAFITTECKNGQEASFLAKYGLTDSKSYLQGVC